MSLRNVIFYCGLFCVLNVVAQPTITAPGVNPVLGQTYNYPTCTDINPGPAGANQTWNFSAISCGTPDAFSCILPSATPNGSSFTTSNVCMNGPSYPTYWSATPSVYANCGFDNTNIVAYSNPEDYLRFPFTFLAALPLYLRKSFAFPICIQ